MRALSRVAVGVLVIASCHSADAAGVEGRAVLRGTPPPEIVIAMSGDCAAAQTKPPTTRHYLVNKDGGLANVFVVIRSGLGGKELAPQTNEVTMDCVACQTEPYVVAVQTGQRLVFRNNSAFQENIHFTGKLNKEWNFGLRAHSRLERRFDTAEDFIRIKGDVHPWFFGYVCVVNHPFFAVTGVDGRFQFPDGLPDGTYVIEAKHLKAGSVRKEIVVRNGRTDSLEFALDVPPRP